MEPGALRRDLLPWYLGAPIPTDIPGSPPFLQASRSTLAPSRRSHLARVGLPAPVDLAEAPSPDDAVHAEVVHGQLWVWQQQGSLWAAWALPRGKDTQAAGGQSHRGVHMHLSAPSHPHWDPGMDLPPPPPQHRLGAEGQNALPSPALTKPRCPAPWGGQQGGREHSPPQPQPTHVDVELHILPLAKPCEFIAVREEPRGPKSFRKRAK